MANEPTILGSEPTGWRTLFDYASGTSATLRIRVRQGPAKTLDAETAALKGALDVDAIDQSVSPGSAVATVRCTYGTAPAAGFELGERRAPAFALNQMMDVVDIRAHPKSQGIASAIPAIERYISQGDVAGLLAAYAGNVSALYFAALWVAGVSSYEAAAMQLTVTRYYASAPSLASDYAAINQVFSWAAIRTDGKAIPSYVDEPKYIRATGAAAGFEWRLLSVAPVIQRGEENVVVWTFVGRERYAKELYKGGSWDPQPLS